MNCLSSTPKSRLFINTINCPTSFLYYNKGTLRDFSTFVNWRFWCTPLYWLLNEFFGCRPNDRVSSPIVRKLPSVTVSPQGPICRFGSAVLYTNKNIVFVNVTEDWFYFACFLTNQTEKEKREVLYVKFLRKEYKHTNLYPVSLISVILLFY